MRNLINLWDLLLLGPNDPPGAGEPSASAVDPPTPVEGDPPAPTPVRTIPPPDKDDWKVDTITKLRAQKRDLEAQLAAKQANTGNPSPSDDTRMSEAEIDRRASAKAQGIAFNNQCIALLNEGEEKFPDDWKSRVDAFKQLDEPQNGNSSGKYVGLIQAIIETGEGARLMYELGGDMNKASKLLELSPVRLGVALAKMLPREEAKGDDEDESASKKDRQLSSAPKPITPVGGKGPSHTAIDPTDPERSDRLSTSEWMARRNAQEDAKRQAGRAGR